MRLNLLLQKITFAAVVILSITGCADNYKWRKVDAEYKNMEHKFSLAFPNNWMYRASNIGSDFYLEAQSPATIRRHGTQLASYMIHIYKSKATTPPQPFLSKNFKKTGEGKAMIGGYNAVYISYDIAVENNMQDALNSTSFVTFGPHKVYTFLRPPYVFRITLTATDQSTFDVYIPTFEEIIDSTKFW